MQYQSSAPNYATGYDDNRFKSTRYSELTRVTRTLLGHNVYELKIDGFIMPYVVKTHGPVPEGGRPLLITLHGGGSASAEINEENWKVFFRLIAHLKFLMDQ